MERKMPQRKYSLGKLPATKDLHTLQLKTVLQELPPIPDTFDVDESLDGIIPNPMFANDAWGDCVIAARAHMTRRFEMYEQGKVLNITDSDVLHEYWMEQGAKPTYKFRFCKLTTNWPDQPNNGLNMLNSLKAWRKGWECAGHKYNIYTFGEVDHHDHELVKAVIYLLNGCYFGFLVPQFIWDIPIGEPWHTIGKPPFIIDGGHAVYSPKYEKLAGYNEVGPVCVTWGRLQQMTWEFWDIFVDEAFGIVDNRNNFMGSNSPVDIEKFDNYLKQICGG
jgi:hypothetical protein